MRLVIKTLRKNKEKPKEHSVVAYRQNMDKIAESLPDFPPEIYSTPEQAGQVPVEWITHKDVVSDSVVLYLHGGGYISGNLAISKYFITQFIQRIKIPFLYVDYSLAPERPFPAALDDSVSAYQWLLETKKYLPKQIIFFGESAGGGLVLATLIKLRELNFEMPSTAVCLSPWVDLAGTGESMVTKADIDPILSIEEMNFLVKQYVGEYNLHNPLISPLYADLHGLPPLFIQVGTSEMILDDSLRIAQKAEDASVKVTLDVWEEMPHVFALFFQYAPESRKAIERICEYITKHLQ